jgi:hypothetical protein
MRDAVVDPGDPYLVSWIMWWDYHQTFRDPLNLFHANIFYPLRYTLAFSEHCYGVALPFFPLFALGLRPLTVQCVAMFLGFAFSGYGAFRLARTLTGSYGVAWVAGIAFAFVPFRLTLMSQLVYLFSAWIPLLFEAVVLFVRQTTWKRAIWLSIAFFMLGLTSVSFFAFALVPLVLVVAVLTTRYERWRNQIFWQRGAIAIVIASLALLPFMVPYYLVSRLYGFTRSIEEVKANSALPIHWLSVENRNKLWFGMGENLPGGTRFKLFPGLLTLVFSFVALLHSGGVKAQRRVEDTRQNGGRSSSGSGESKLRVVTRLDVLALCLLPLSLLAIGFEGTPYFGGLFRYLTSEIVLAALAVVIIARLCLAYPQFLRTANANLVQTVRSQQRSDIFWVGMLLSLVGFCYSLGWNFFFYRLCYDLLPVFRSIRVPTRGAMFAYLGLALLAGEGARVLVESIRQRWTSSRPVVAYSIICALFLFELNAAPLSFIRGAVYPDAVTLRLKQTQMRGGVAVLPAGPDYNHSYMLRAADHEKPLIVGTSGFNSHQEDRIEQLTRAGAIDNELLALLESVPASYLVVKNELIKPERKLDYEVFLRRAVMTGSLRFINRFDAQDDLYAVVKTEPQAKSESAFPLGIPTRDWETLLEEDATSLLGYQESWSKAIYRVHVVAFGSMPRYSEFITDVRQIGAGLIPGRDEDQQIFEDNLHKLAQGLVRRPPFVKVYAGLDNQRFVEHLYANAGVVADPAKVATLAGEVSSGASNREDVILKVASDARVAEQHDYRALVLLHYFAYFQRNPDDPPDRNLKGFDFWLQSEDARRNPSLLTAAFKESIEYRDKAGK